jgi:hypothetical protein
LVVVSPKHCTSSATRSSSPDGARNIRMTEANPGMDSVELDVADPGNIGAVTKKLISDYFLVRCCCAFSSS